MEFSDTIVRLDPESIIVHREKRQRTVIDTSDIIDSIRLRGVYNPIIITRDLVLKAGERRLQACRELGIQVPCRFVDTLSAIESEIVELEENLKRLDLPWQDMVRATARIHEMYSALDSEWNITRTAEQLGVSQGMVSQILLVSKRMDDPRVSGAAGWKGAYNVLAREGARKTDAMVATLLEATQAAFESVAVPSTAAVVKPVEDTPPKPKSDPDAITQGNFLEWAPKYSGQKFNLIHCDFPYGIDVFAGPLGPRSSTQSKESREVLYNDSPENYRELVECLVDNIERLLAHSGHVMFWFSMKHYEYTRIKLGRVLEVNPTPLIWFKSDNMGVIPDPKRGPRQVHEVAFLCHRGNRFIVKPVADTYSGPTDKSLHPSAKPEPILRHFFSMLVDGTTRLLDPTCGGGSAIRVAEEFNAEFAMGLEVDPEYVDRANQATRKSRIMRAISRG